MELQNNNIVNEFPNFEGIISSCKEMQSIFEIIKKVSKTDTTILVLGESGTGKELIAKAIHTLSKRQGRLVPVNCAAIPEEILESELFGHEKGAFTGADNLVKGRFELAHESSIFLDEIGEINPSVQIKILRVLQEKAFERVGGQETINVDVRIIAATNRVLEEEVKKGTFREDLYYRLNVIHIHVPPLRERKDDIPLLVASFLEEFAVENGKNIKGIDSQAKSAIYNYNWPGNIRELRNCIESAVVMCSGEEIKLEDLPPTVSKSAGDQSINIPANATLDEAEKIIILQTLAANKNNKSKTADLLGIGRKTLHRKLEEYGINSDDSE